MARNNTAYQKASRAEAKRCGYCNEEFNKKYKATIEHFYPLDADKKHLNRAWNKLIVCGKCNTDKTNLMPERFIWLLKKKIKTVPYGCRYWHRATNSLKNVRRLINELEGHYINREIL